MSRLRQAMIAIPSMGLAAALALYGLTPREMTDAVIDAAVVLRSMARTPDEIVDLIVAESGASGPGDMGKVMGLAKAQLAGKAEMSAVSAAVKAALSA